MNPILPDLQSYIPQDSLVKQRMQALDQFMKTGLPTRKLENWKYTDLTRLLAGKEFTPLHNGKSHAQSAKLLQHSIRLVLINGQFDSQNLANLPSGISVMSFREAALNAPELIKQWHDQSLALTDHPMLCLNTALASDGIVLQIAENTKITQPIEIVYAYDHAHAHMLNYCNIIIAGEHSEFTVLEHAQHSVQNSLLLNTASHLLIKQAARVNHVMLQPENAALTHTAYIHARQLKDSHLYGFNAALGSAVARYDFHSNLDESGASCEMDGLYVLSNKQHADIHTRVEHRASHTHSDQLYKGVIDNQAHGVFNGTAVVHKGVKSINAHQINRNLLLAKTATIDTKPELIIDADDVKCSHGATVGQLDTNALFYLQSRGIPQALARKLLTQAFTTECMNRLPQDTLLPWLQKLVADKMERHFSIGA